MLKFIGMSLNYITFLWTKKIHQVLFVKYKFSISRLLNAGIGKKTAPLTPFSINHSQSTLSFNATITYVAGEVLNKLRVNNQCSHFQ